MAFIKWSMSCATQRGSVASVRRSDVSSTHHERPAGVARRFQVAENDICAATPQRRHVLDDGGADWVPINTGLEQLTGLTDLIVATLAIDPLVPATLYAGTDGGVFQSIDGGAHWLALNTSPLKSLQLGWRSSFWEGNEQRPGPMPGGRRPVASAGRSHPESLAQCLGIEPQRHTDVLEAERPGRVGRSEPARGGLLRHKSPPTSDLACLRPPVDERLPVKAPERFLEHRRHQPLLGEPLGALSQLRGEDDQRLELDHAVSQPR
jgi:hypothetical protein